MNRHHTLAWFAFSVVTTAFTPSVTAQQHQMAGPMGDEDVIKSAMTAAPPAIAKDATVIAISEDGKIRVVRKGTNNFTCLADNPNSPGPDPMCGDQNAMEWAQAWIEK
jgi:hypothetical protein